LVKQAELSLGTNPARRISYSYDEIDQLKSEVSSPANVGAYLNTSYDYDSMGNRLQVQTLNPDGTLNNRSSYTPNKLNQITQLVSTPQSGTPSTRALSYDPSGNLTRMGLPEGSGGTTYLYDEADRLTSIVQADETSGVNQRKSEFVYDGSSRKVISREYSWDASVTPAVWKLQSETRRIYDGMDVVQERDGNNQTTVNYTRDGNIGGLLARTVMGQPATATTPATPDRHFFYHYDGSGNVVQLTDAGQQTVAEYSYDAYGNVRSSGGAHAGQPYRYSTKEYDAASGLYDYGYRFYLPSMGRWLNRDPIQEAGGLNLYGFVKNKVTKYADLNGLFPIPTDSIPSGDDYWRDLKKYGDCMISCGCSGLALAGGALSALAARLAAAAQLGRAQAAVQAARAALDALRATGVTSGPAYIAALDVLLAAQLSQVAAAGAFTEAMLALAAVAVAGCTLKCVNELYLDNYF
jgi:RHS repeat-associated protein